MVTSIFSPLSRDRHMSWVNHKIMESVAYLGYSVSYKKKTLSKCAWCRFEILEAKIKKCMSLTIQELEGALQIPFSSISHLKGCFRRCNLIAKQRFYSVRVWIGERTNSGELHTHVAGCSQRWDWTERGHWSLVSLQRASAHSHASCVTRAMSLQYLSLNFCCCLVTKLRLTLFWSYGL